MKIQPEILPKPKEMQSMVNFVVKKGNKILAESIIKNTLFLFTKTLKKKKPYKLLRQSLKTLTPMVNVIALKRKHRSFQVPESLSKKKKLLLVNKWLLSSSRTSTKQSMFKNLSNELSLTLSKRSYANKKRKELHALAISLRKKTKNIFK